MRSCTLILLLLLSIQLKSQESSKSAYTLTPKVHYGFVWNFDEEVSHLANQHFPAFELNFTKQTYGDKSWQQEFRFPQVGYSLFYYSFDSQKPIGNALALIAHAGKNLYKTKRSNLQWRLGFGTAFVNKRFDVKNNFKNNLISQRINFTMSGQLNFNYKISSKLNFNIGLGILHISNGALKRPNFGINLPSANIGIGYTLSKTDKVYKKDSTLAFASKTFVHISPYTGYKEVYPVNGPKYFLGGMNMLVERRVNKKSGLQAGIDFSYDHSKKSEIILDTIPVANTFLNRAQAGIVMGHELYINRLSLVTHVGVYVYDPTHINKKLYQKVGFKYYLTDKIFTGMIMKIHLGVADWIEWGIGTRL